MKVIIAGSRSITDYQLVSQVISNTLAKHNIQITEVVSGGADGVDTLGEQWALENNVPVEPMLAEWDIITGPNVSVKINKWGKKYNARAGFQRNERMAIYGDVLIAIWDGKSHGTKDMISRATKHGLLVLEYKTK
jgi:hypothetical protein